MICPICNKRKARRFCPALTQSICSECCGREREVSIDCPTDCPHLMTCRQYDAQRKEIDWKRVPFPEAPFRAEFVAARHQFLSALSFAICEYAAANRFVVDSDVRAGLEALAGTYRTLTSGIYYEQRPELLVQRELYDRIKKAIEEFRKTEAQRAVQSIRDSEIRDVLICLAQLGYMHDNGRPKGRAFLDSLRSQFGPEIFAKPASNIILMP